jgi:hypothetical protein
MGNAFTSSEATSPARLRAAWALAAVLACSPGCSWIWVTRTPDLPLAPSPPVECTRSTLLPALDVAGATVAGTTSVLLFVMAATLPAVPGCPTSSPDCLTPAERNAALGYGTALLATGVAATFSAVHGFRSTARCREVTGWQSACLSGFEDDCWKLVGATPVAPLPELPGHLRPAEAPATPGVAPAPAPARAPAPAPPPASPPPPEPAPLPPPKSPFGTPARPRTGVRPGRVVSTRRPPPARPA